MKKSMLIAASAAFVLMAAETYAQGGGMGGQGGQRPDFASLDANEDGMLSVEEMASLNTEEQPERASNMLSRLDSDTDGMLSEEEYNTRPQRQGGGMGG